MAYDAYDDSRGTEIAWCAPCTTMQCTTTVHEHRFIDDFSLVEYPKTNTYYVKRLVHRIHTHTIPCRQTNLT